MTDEQFINEVQAELEKLIRFASRRGVRLAGFAFKEEEPLMLINFGNVSDMHKVELYHMLTELCQRQRDSGYSTQVDVGEVN